MKYQHIVFDADGTLLDTEYAILLSLQDTVKTLLNKHMEFDELRFCLGIPGDATLEQLQTVRNILDLRWQRGYVFLNQRL